jgi:hypothetical protein
MIGYLRLRSSRTQGCTYVACPRAVQGSAKRTKLTSLKSIRAGVQTGDVRADTQSNKGGPKVSRRDVIRGASYGAGAGVLVGGAIVRLAQAISHGAAISAKGFPRARHVPSDIQPPQRVDVAVIGGGIVGASTALSLAERGISVALFEKGAVAGEASGRAGTHRGPVQRAGRPGGTCKVADQYFSLQIQSIYRRLEDQVLRMKRVTLNSTKCVYRT